MEGRCLQGKQCSQEVGEVRKAAVYTQPLLFVKIPAFKREVGMEASLPNFYRAVKIVLTTLTFLEITF